MQNHSKPTQTERATWQNSDVWTLWTKIVIYRDKYPFTIGIHNENESHNDCLQSTFAHKFYNSPKPTDLTYRCWHTLCPGDDKSRHWTACPVHVSRKWTHTIWSASKRGFTLPTLACTPMVSLIQGRAWCRMDLGRIWNKAKFIKHVPLTLAWKIPWTEEPGRL